MTDAFDLPVEGGPEASAAANTADEAFTPADLVTAGDALAPALDPAIDAPVDPGPVGDAAQSTTSDAPATSDSPVPRIEMEPGDASLLGLIDRLGSILERSDLSELEVEAGQTIVVLRTPVAVAPPAAQAQMPPPADAQPAVAPSPVGDAGLSPATSGAGQPAGGAPRPSVKAPLTGIWYASPTPGSAPFVEVGRELAVGQVVGLIEAMKLFNEIKSDLAGRVLRVVPDSGTLVKAKQPLIEVEPL